MEPAGARDQESAGLCRCLAAIQTLNTGLGHDLSKSIKGSPMDHPISRAYDILDLIYVHLSYTILSPSFELPLHKYHYL